jgi:DNA (cytosine-5)-methyltransferase 1
MHVVDLFSGCGGLAFGAKAAGLRTVLGIEADQAAAESFAVNFPNAVTLASKIQEIEPTSLALPKGDLILCGGPPCQGFSTSNQRNRDANSPRNQLYTEMLRFSDALSPKCFVFENVLGITEGKKREVINQLLDELKRRFVTVDWAVLNAAQFGVPQLRRRVFVIARTSRRPFKWPHPQSDLIAVSDAIKDLPVLRNGAQRDVRSYPKEPTNDYARKMRGCLIISTGHSVTRNDDWIVSRYKHIPKGGNWRDIPDELMTSYADKSRCHTGIYRRLSWSTPSIVIGNFRKNMLIHPTQNRGLSIREAARLQSFPDSFIFCGSIGKRQQQVGNAVPPRLAAAVFKAVTDV